jgi:hypothetical protein
VGRLYSGNILRGLVSSVKDKTLFEIDFDAVALILYPDRIIHN